MSGTDKTGIQVEYQRLVYIAKEDSNGKFIEATKEYNHNKNRYHNILPYEKNRVKLAYQVNLNTNCLKNRPSQIRCSVFCLSDDHNLSLCELDVLSMTGIH